MFLQAHRDVAVTGLGAVCAIGNDCDALWSSIQSGRSGIDTIRRFSTSEFGVTTGGLVPETEDLNSGSGEAALALCLSFSERSAREAMLQARLHDPSIPRDRVALVFGTGLVGQNTPIHELAEELADRLDIFGPRLTVSTACSSSTGAIGIARELIAIGAADVVLAGGADVLTPEVFAGFHALGVLSKTKCAPFSTPLGTTLGEGAGFAVLERGDLARRRGARIVVAFSGYGLSGDGWHETSPDPKGAGTERAIRAALGDACVGPTEIEYVNAHGSGTEANDPAEWLGIQGGLGAHASAIPISSTKGALGHAQGAAGILEAIVTILCMERGVVPPTLNFGAPRRRGPVDPVGVPVPRTRDVHRALSLNAAFGGANAALIFSRPNGTSPTRMRRKVLAMGLGIVSDHGLGAEAYAAGSNHGRGNAARVGEFALEAILPDSEVRGLDPASTFLTAAAALALKDSGVIVRGPLRNRTGLLVGQRCASPSSLLAFHQSIEARGLVQLSARAFARIVLNAAAGCCSKILSLRGPLSAITTGAGSGLAAVVLAAEMLSTRDESDIIVAGATEECAPAGYSGIAGTDEGAACLVLANERGALHAATTEAIEIAGWGIAGPGLLDAAISRACASRDDIDQPCRVFRAGDAGSHARSVDDATTSLLALADALLAIRRGEIDRALVTSDSGRSASIAVLLVR